MGRMTRGATQFQEIALSFSKYSVIKDFHIFCSVTGAPGLANKQTLFTLPLMRPFTVSIHTGLSPPPARFLFLITGTLLNPRVRHSIHNQKDYFKCHQTIDIM